MASFFDGLLGSVVGGALEYFGAEEANDERVDAATRAQDFSGAQVQQQMGFQRDMTQWSMDYNRNMAEQAQQFSAQMSNTSWQRGIQDMKAAGINPILAATKGAATSPTGVSGSVGAPSGGAATGVNPAIENTLRGAATTALGGIRLNQELQNMQAVEGREKANTALLQAQAGVANAQQRNLDTNTALTTTQLPNAAVQRLLQEATTARTVADRDRILRELGNLIEYGRPGFDAGSLRSQLDSASAGGVGGAVRDTVEGNRRTGQTATDAIGSLVDRLRAPNPEGRTPAYESIGNWLRGVIRGLHERRNNQ